MKCRHSSGLSSGPPSYSSCFSGPASLLVAALVAGGACSHEQPPPAEVPLPLAHGPAPAAAPAARTARSSPSRPTEQTSSRETPAIFFDFDSAVLREDAHPALQHVADRVRDRRDALVRVEGNCDRLGTVEYNLALGEHRARAAKDYLISLGIPDQRIATVSYGSERPKYPGQSEDERAKNRRDDLVIR
jgi:peptidoglycan-associated lipoprotein